MKEFLKDGSVVEKCYNGYRLLQCPDVEHYKMPDEVVEVSPSAFQNAGRLVSVNFNNVELLDARKEYIYEEKPYFEGTGWAGYEKTMTGTVYHSVFENCPFVSRIEMPRMESIGSFALSGLKRVLSITLPACMRVCGNFAFYDSAIESIVSCGGIFVSILDRNGEDIFFSDSLRGTVEINPNDYTNNLCRLRQVVLYDKETSRVKRAMYTISKLSNISEITFSTPFIASMMREIYSKYSFADRIKDLGIEGDSINRITVVCFCAHKPYVRPNNFGVDILLSDKDFVILEKLAKEYPDMRKDATIIQKYEPDLYNTILSHVINDKNGGEPIERMEVRIGI